jgi:NADH dehydrogenase FAD-containing subunit
MAIDSKPKKPILILGSGFGGLYTSLHLGKEEL